jgi:hypothetical protein
VIRIVTLILTLLLLFAAIAHGQTNADRPWEKYGMSQVEWKKFQASGLTLKELEELLKMGVTLNEVLSRPWISLQITKRQWLRQRKQGLSNEDIEAFYGEKQEGDYRVFMGLVPGLMQFRNGEPLKASILLGGSTYAICVSPGRNAGHGEN